MTEPTPLDLISSHAWHALLDRLSQENTEKKEGAQSRGVPLLFAACQCLAPENALRAILSADPNAARHEAGRKGLPIHEACRQCDRLSMDIIILLIDAYPEGLHKKDGKGQLPLHAACSCHNTTSGPPNEGQPGEQGQIETIRLLLDHYPEGAMVADENGMFPLHLVTQLSLGSEEIVGEVLEAYPEAAKIPHICSDADLGCDGYLPLHFLCRRKPGAGVVAEILEANPNALSTVGKLQGECPTLPLHIACKMDAPAEVIKLLLENDADAATAEDAIGLLPLDYAWREFSGSQDAIQRLNVLVSANPLAAYGIRYRQQSGWEKCNGASDDDNVPKGKLDATTARLEHFYCVRPRLVDALPLRGYDERQMFAAAYSEDGCGIRNKHGDLPLHVACKCAVPSNLTLCILRAYPAATKITDKMGRLPLHLAVMHDVELKVVRELVAHNGSPLRTVDPSGFVPAALVCLRSGIWKEDSKGEKTTCHQMSLAHLLLRECPDVISTGS